MYLHICIDIYAEYKYHLFHNKLFLHVYNRYIRLVRPLMAHLLCFHHEGHNVQNDFSTAQLAWMTRTKRETKASSMQGNRWELTGCGMAAMTRVERAMIGRLGDGLRSAHL